jgi:hypothetical protein
MTTGVGSDLRRAAADVLLVQSPGGIANRSRYMSSKHQHFLGDLDAEALSRLISLPDEALLTTHEAAELLRLKYNTLVWYRSNGDGPKFKRLGPKCIRYQMADLRAYTEGAF